MAALQLLDVATATASSLRLAIPRTGTNICSRLPIHTTKGSRPHGFENLRQWFQALYEVLLGQSSGPRMGSFVALYGVEETVALLDRVLSGEDLAA